MIGITDAGALGNAVKEKILNAGLEPKGGYDTCGQAAKMQQLHEHTKLRFMDAGLSEDRASEVAKEAIVEYYDKLNNDWKGIPNNMAVRVYNRKAKQMDLPQFEEKPRKDGLKEIRFWKGNGKGQQGDFDENDYPVVRFESPAPGPEGRILFEWRNHYPNLEEFMNDLRTRTCKKSDDVPFSLIPRDQVGNARREPIVEAANLNQLGDWIDGCKLYPGVAFGDSKGMIYGKFEDMTTDEIYETLSKFGLESREKFDACPMNRVTDSNYIASTYTDVAEFINKYEPASEPGPEPVPGPVPGPEHYDCFVFGDDDHGRALLYCNTDEPFESIIEKMTEYLLDIGAELADPEKLKVVPVVTDNVNHAWEMVPAECRGYFPTRDLINSYEVGNSSPEPTPEPDPMVSIPKGRKIIRRRDESLYLAPKEFDDLLILLMQKFNVILEGVPGCGKTEMAIAIAEVLGIPVYIVTSPQDRYDVIGYNDANGNYVPTDFVKAYGQECVLILDEIDRATNDARICINSALANGILATPKGNIPRHPGCRIVACANTSGKGATANHQSAIAFDASTLDRFVTLRVGYDKAIEDFITGNDKDLVEFLDDYRKTCQAVGIDTPLVSYRGMANLAKMKNIMSLKGTDPVKDIETKLKEVVVNGSPTVDFGYFKKVANLLRSALGKEQVTGDDFKTIANAMPNQDNPYVKELKSLARIMNEEGVLDY